MVAVFFLGFYPLVGKAIQSLSKKVEINLDLEDEMPILLSFFDQLIVPDCSKRFSSAHMPSYFMNYDHIYKI